MLSDLPRWVGNWSGLDGVTLLFPTLYSNKIHCFRNTIHTATINIDEK